MKNILFLLVLLSYLAFSKTEFRVVQFTGGFSESLNFTNVLTVKSSSQIECSRKCAAEETCIGAIKAADGEDCKLLEISAGNSAAGQQMVVGEVPCFWRKDVAQKLDHSTETATTTTTGNNSCLPVFTQTDQGCFYLDPTHTVAWDEAEEQCQKFDPDAHLMNPDSREVICCAGNTIH